MNIPSATVRSFLFYLAAFLIFPACNETPSSQESDEMSNDATHQPSASLFVGTYTRKEGHVDGQADGIYRLEVNPETGALSEGGVIRDTNPSFLALSSDGTHLYAVSEVTSPVAPTGSVTAYRLDPATGNMERLNQQSSHGEAPCHLAVDRTGQYVIVANYVGGVVAVLPVAADGSLQPASDVLKLEGSGSHPRQEASHPHMVCLSPDNRFVYVPDLGSNRVHIFQLELDAGKLVSATPAYAEVQAEAGPRHMTIDPAGRFTYLINELDNTVNVFQRDEDSGALEELQVISTLPENYDGPDSYCADIHLSPDARFLYGSNRGHNSLVIYAVDQASGRLTLIGHESTRGDYPRNFMISPDGRFLYAANQNSNNISIYERDADSGTLRYREEYRVPTPVCLKML